MLTPNMIHAAVFQYVEDAAKRGTTSKDIRQELGFSRESVELSLLWLVRNGAIQRGEYIHDGKARWRVYRAIRPIVRKNDIKIYHVEVGEKFATLQEHIDALQCDDDFSDVPATVPTGTLRGSPERVAVMRMRVERGESPFHEDDSTETHVSTNGALDREHFRHATRLGIRVVDTSQFYSGKRFA